MRILINTVAQREDHGGRERPGWVHRTNKVLAKGRETLKFR